MMRSFIVLLLLIVVFLAGVLIGMERNEGGMYVNNNSSEINEVEQTDKVIHWEEDEELLMLEKQMLEMESPEQTTQKVATFLEAGVKGFYEVIVEALFQISSLFI